jgi:hypothetical protein
MSKNALITISLLLFSLSAKSDDFSLVIENRQSLHLKEVTLKGIVDDIKSTDTKYKNHFSYVSFSLNKEKYKISVNYYLYDRTNKFNDSFPCQRGDTLTVKGKLNASKSSHYLGMIEIKETKLLNCTKEAAQELPTQNKNEVRASIVAQIDQELAEIKRDKTNEYFLKAKANSRLKTGKFFLRIEEYLKNKEFEKAYREILLLLLLDFNNSALDDLASEVSKSKDKKLNRDIRPTSQSKLDISDNLSSIKECQLTVHESEMVERLSLLMRMRKLDFDGINKSLNADDYDVLADFEGRVYWPVDKRNTIITQPFLVYSLKMLRDKKCVESDKRRALRIQHFDKYIGFLTIKK